MGGGSTESTDLAVERAVEPASGLPLAEACMGAWVFGGDKVLSLA